jgi:hypothetical protein
MKKALTVRLNPDLLDAARSCAAREHRTLTNFIEVSLLERMGQSSSDVAQQPRPSHRSEDHARGD